MDHLLTIANTSPIYDLRMTLFLRFHAAVETIVDMADKRICADPMREIRERLAIMREALAIAERRLAEAASHEANYPAHTVADADSPTDPHRMADAVFAATKQPKASAAK